MKKTFKEQLEDWERKYKKKGWNNKNSNGKRKKCTDCKCKNERLTKKELLDLMGVHRPTYSRGRGGAFKQK